MPGRAFAPGRIQVLVGDTVVWRNADGTNHTVTSDDDLFDSGFIAPGLTFAEAFAKPGTYALPLLDPQVHARRGRRRAGRAVGAGGAGRRRAAASCSRGSRRPGRRGSRSCALGGGGQRGRPRRAGRRRQLHACRCGSTRPADFNALAKGAREPARPRRGRAERARAPERRRRCSASAAPKRPGAQRRAPALRARALRLADGHARPARRPRRRARSRSRSARAASASSFAAATAGRTGSRRRSSSSAARDLTERTARPRGLWTNRCDVWRTSVTDT